MEAVSRLDFIRRLLAVAFLLAVAGVPLALGQAVPPVFTGNVENDFLPATCVVVADPGGMDVGVPRAMRGLVSGNDMKDARFYYDVATDTLYVGLNTYGIAGDVDGDGDPGRASAALAANGGYDYPDFAGSESFTLMIDTDTDGAIDVIAGVSGVTNISGFTVAAFAGSKLAPGYAFGPALTGHVGTLYASPSASAPDLEFMILNYSTLPRSSGNASASYAISAFVGSLSDDGIGEDFIPGMGQFQPVPSGAIGDLVWSDLNGDGVQDVDEPGIAGIAVDLLDSSLTVVATRTTDALGKYVFLGLLPGDYLVRVTGTDDVLDGLVLTGGVDPHPVSLAAEQVYLDADFGYQVLGTVFGHVYLDSNGNGTQDAGEPDLPGISVKVTDSNGNTLTVTTDSKSNWAATVPPGATSAEVLNPPPGTIQTEGTETTAVTAVAGATTDAGIDGYYLPATLTGHVYLDSNGNGTQDAGEPDLAGIGILVTASNGSTQTVTTEAHGNWTARLPPGATTADVLNPPAGTTQTQGTDPTTVTAVAGASTDAGIDGYYLPATVTGHVYKDTNGNGRQGCGEPDLAGIKVLVTDSNGNTRTVTTDANGNWTATVPPGATTADVLNPPTGSTQTEGTDPTTVTAVAGTSTNAGIDGYYRSCLPTTVYGHVYKDTNGNGRQGCAEPDLAGIKVLVTDSTGNARTVTTDANGNWTATVPPGVTKADVLNPPTGSTQTEGTDPTTVTAVAGTNTSAGIDGYYRRCLVRDSDRDWGCGDRDSDRDWGCGERDSDRDGGCGERDSDRDGGCGERDSDRDWGCGDRDSDRDGGCGERDSDRDGGCRR